MDTRIFALFLLASVVAALAMPEPRFARVPRSASYPNFGPYGGPVDPGFAPYPFQDFHRAMQEQIRDMHARIQAQHQAIFDAQNSVGNEGLSPGPGGPQSAIAGIGIGPGGGFQYGEISPASPGIESRFAEDLPAPSGNSYGVFASSSSSTKVGPDGRQYSKKTSTTGVNDNGNVRFRTVTE